MRFTEKKLHQMEQNSKDDHTTQYKQNGDIIGRSIILIRKINIVKLC